MILIIFCAVLLGLIVGSFLNVVVWRTVTGDSFVGGRSKCTSCGHPLGWRDLVPIVSYILLRGRCRYCKEPIPSRYPAVECATAVLFALGVAHGISVGEAAIIVRDIVFLSFLIVLFVIDLFWMVIPDRISIVAWFAAFALQMVIYRESFFCGGNPLLCIGGHTWVIFLFASAVGGGFFYLQYVLSKKTWVGGGDIRLGAVMGMMLGWPQVLIGLFIAYLLGSAVAVPLLILGKKGMKSAVPFGPFLVTSTVLMLLYGTPIMSWFSQLFAGI